MTEEAKEELEENNSNECKRDLDLINFEIYICALASLKSKHQFDFLLSYWDKDEENTEEKAFKIQHAFLGVINKYRLIKDEPKYFNPDRTINFYKMTDDISYDRRQSYIIKNGDFEGKDKENVIELPCLNLAIIKHIITTLDRYE